jgi:hypothetical protein
MTPAPMTPTLFMGWVMLCLLGIELENAIDLNDYSFIYRGKKSMTEESE